MTPVQYIDYGPFGSYAPAVNQAMHDKYSESDISILRGAYGSAAGALYAESVTNFVQDSSSWVADHVDRLLDTYTEKAHSSALDFIVKKKHDQRIARAMSVKGGSKSSKNSKNGKNGEKLDEHEKNEKTENSTELNKDSPQEPTLDQIEGLKSLKSLGINVDFLNDDEEHEFVEGGLDASGKNILKLKELQDDRLKKRPKLYGERSHVKPTDKEKSLACKIENGLASIVEKSKTGPRDIVSVGVIREALGVKL